MTDFITKCFWYYKARRNYYNVRRNRGQININSIRNKFEILKSMLLEVMITDKHLDDRLDDYFPEQRFHIEGFNKGLFRIRLFRIVTV